MSWTAMPVVGEWYGRESGGSWIFFDVTATDTATATPDQGTAPAATLVAPDGSRARVPGERLRRLAALPSFRVVDVTVPETARPRSRVEVAVTVRNEGDSRGYWFGGIQWGGVFYRPTVSVAPGETGRASSDVRVSEGSISIRLRWPGEERSFSIDAPVEDTPTETPTP
ncbi:hypothetical protein RYH80_17490 [Halobaculum sp. MBLA0147]|uniref:hypothetical protein n=1 Tax=Halobaculum sp. MBLA0147 TaxID=3079934 RepID=UPI00352531E4